MKNFFLKYEIFRKNHPPTRHLKYKVIDFTPSNKSITTNKLHSSNVERFPRQNKSPLSSY